MLILSVHLTEQDLLPHSSSPNPISGLESSPRFFDRCQAIGTHERVSLRGLASVLSLGLSSTVVLQDLAHPQVQPIATLALSRSLIPIDRCNLALGKGKALLSFLTHFKSAGDYVVSITVEVWFRRNATSSVRLLGIDRS